MGWKIKETRDQADFCLELCKRLASDIRSAKEWHNGIEKYCRMKDDIKRIRRELLSLSTMLDPWG